MQDDIKQPKSIGQKIALAVAYVGAVGCVIWGFRKLKSFKNADVIEKVKKSFDIIDVVEAGVILGGVAYGANKIHEYDFELMSNKNKKLKAENEALKKQLQHCAQDKSWIAAEQERGEIATANQQTVR